MGLFSRRRCVLGLIAMAICAAAAVPAAMRSLAAGEPSFERSEVTVVTLRGRFRFAVEMAVTTAQRQQGLQGRASMPAEFGMLFDFGRNQPV